LTELLSEIGFRRVLLIAFRAAVSSAALAAGMGCAHAPPTEKQNNPESIRLTQIIHDYAEAAKRVDAYAAPYFNIEEDLGKFGDYPSEDYFARSKTIVQIALNSLKNVEPSQLLPQDQLTYRLFKEDMEVSLHEFDFPGEYLSVTQMGSRLHEFMDSSSDALTIFPFDTVKHYDDYLSRVAGFKDYVDRQIAVLKKGVKKKVVLSCTVVSKVPNVYHDALEKDVEKNPFYRPVLFMPKNFPLADRSRLTQSFRKAVAETVVPGYQKFDHYFRTDYAKHCRSGFGLKGLPNSKAWYQAEIRASTSLELDPKSIHQTGLNEVARISGEIEKIKNQRGFKGRLKDFLAYMKNEPNSFFKSRDEMFEAFNRVKIATAAKIPHYFSLIPTSDFKIVETSNPEDAAGSYNQPTETYPYGRFLVNTKNLKSVAVYGVTTLMLHETVPGHHFQLALQYEMRDKLSEYQRKMYGSNAFAEGWALYSEYLGNEMGMYTDPMQRFGNLNDEMLRAVRLVVDTGIHDLGWSQKKTIAYMTEHLAEDAKEIETEANRYSVWPGQALGYKIGQLKIIELRKKAEAALGNKFDIKGFHRAVIGNGTVSLGVLETQIDNWIAEVAKK
jgi:uncharacterized protein (DUF885 family)